MQTRFITPSSIPHESSIPKKGGEQLFDSDGFALNLSIYVYDSRFSFTRLSTRSLLWSGETLLVSLSGLKNLLNWGRKELAPYTYEVEEEISSFVGLEEVDRKVKRLTMNSNMTHTENRRWKQNSRGLCVFISGVDAEHTVFNQYILKIVQDFPSMDIFTPVITSTEGRSAQEMALQINSTVTNYLSENPGRKITIFSFSYGAMVAGQLACNISNYNQSVSLLFISVSGCFLGTKMFNYLESIGMSSKVVDSQHIKEELRYGSGVAVNYLVRMRQNNGINHSYHCFASLDDQMVYPATSCLPLLNNNEVHHFCTGATHHGMLTVAFDVSMRLVYQFYD